MLRLLAAVVLTLLVSACAGSFDSPSCYGENRGKGANRALVVVPCPAEQN